MKGTIKFFHPEETLVYHVKKCFCKVVLQNKKSIFVLEIISTDDLHHVEEDSIQNEFPEIALTIEDFEIEQKSLDDLVGKSIEILNSTEEKINSEGEPEDFIYTNLNVNDGLDIELNKNILKFSLNDKKELFLNWKGIADDFTENNLKELPFEASISFGENIDYLED